MPRLSVIMPVKNGEHTIDRAVRSTLAALPPDAEIVVFNDGSTDQTLERLATLADPRLRVLGDLSTTGAESVGVAGALNALIDNTDSEFVARMDADDVTFRGRFRYQLSALSLVAPVNFTTVVNWWPQRHRIQPPAAAPISTRAFPFHLLLTNPVSHPTMLARRDAVQQVGGYRAVPAEDYDLWLRFANAGIGQRRLPLPTVLYRLHPHQVTASASWRQASWIDETVSGVFQDLAQRLLGQPFLRLSTLSVLPEVDAAGFESGITDFQAAFRAAIDCLSPLEQQFLRRKLASRLVAVRATRRLASVPSVS
jgi:glycosyltransferase involved in cell wall biosynthesis